MRSLTLASMTAAAIALSVTAGGAVARAHRHHPHCSPSASKIRPRVIAPCNRSAIPAGHEFTFKVKDLNRYAHRYPPFLDITNTRPRRGHLREHLGATGGAFAALQPVPGHRGLYEYTPPAYNYPGYWLVTPGRYYVQASQVDVHGRSLDRYGPIIWITIG